MARREKEFTPESDYKVELHTQQLFNENPHAPAIHTVAFPGYGSPAFRHRGSEVITYFDQVHAALHQIEPAHHRLTTVNWPASTQETGKRKNNKKDYSLDIHPIIVQRVIEEIDDELMDSEHVRIKGHSMGGLAVLEWALWQAKIELQTHKEPQFFKRHPSVEAIVEMPALQIHESLHSRMNILKMVGAVPFLDRLLTNRIIHAAMFDLRFNKFLADASLVNGGRYYDHTVSVNNPQALLHHAVQLAELSVAIDEYLPALQFLSAHGVPTHFIFAELDYMVRDFSGELRELLDSENLLGSVTVLKGAHHTEDVHNPQAVAQAIAQVTSFRPSF